MADTGNVWSKHRTADTECSAPSGVYVERSVFIWCSYKHRHRHRQIEPYSCVHQRYKAPNTNTGELDCANTRGCLGNTGFNFLKIQFLKSEINGNKTTSSIRVEQTQTRPRARAKTRAVSPQIAPKHPPPPKTVTPTRFHYFSPRTVTFCQV